MIKKAIIVAPHPDDEIIGCFEYLVSSECMIMFGERKEEAHRDFNLFSTNKIEFSLRTLENAPRTMPILFPDPVFEFHPDHRKYGAIGEEFLRKGYNVIFYSVNMQAPYVHRSENVEMKRLVLDQLYPEKKSLWETDHKYFLFEGYCKWIM